MVHIAPFRALRYKDADMAAVTSPPHDVIHDDELEHYLADAHNICHITLTPGGEERFAKSAKTLAQWQKDGTLVRDERPAFYMYEIEHEGGTMRGFFCRIALDAEYQTIRRHEKTLPKKRSDRYNFLRDSGVNPEPIWMLYRDERGWVDEVLWSNALEGLVDFRDEEGMRHRLWRIDRPEAVGEITAQFEDRTVVIADGHHRYATQLKRWAETGRDEDGSMLVCLVRDTDKGLAIRPTNRLIVALDDVPAAVVQAGRWDAEVLDVPADPEAAAAAFRDAVTDDRTVVVLTAEQAWRLRLRKDALVDQGRGRLDTLAVTILHDHLLAPWGLDLENVEDTLRYSRSDVETVERVRSGEFPVAVMLHGEPVDAVLDVAAAGHVMPQKATYFVPKLRSGIILSPCDEPRPQAMDAGLDPGKADFRMPPLA